ncbi:MAG: hypothetical protein WAT39_22635 [Planctomycetota bacterium]
MRQSTPVLLFALLGCAVAPPPAAVTGAIDGRDAFVALCALAGDWVAAGPEGSTWLSYRRAANGSALVEEMRREPGASPLMMSVYHLDGQALVMTHYCGQGNQPRMRATELAAGRIRFDAFEVANLASPAASRMVRVVFQWRDPERFTQTWTNRAGDRDDAWSFVFTRVGSTGTAPAAPPAGSGR